MEITNPRRILAVSSADATQHLSRVIKGKLLLLLSLFTLLQIRLVYPLQQTKLRSELPGFMIKLIQCYLPKLAHLKG